MNRFCCLINSNIFGNNKKKVFVYFLGGGRMGESNFYEFKTAHVRALFRKKSYNTYDSCKTNKNGFNSREFKSQKKR